MEEAKKPETKEQIDADDRDYKIKDISERNGLKKTPEKRIPKVKEKLKPEKSPEEKLVIEQPDVDKSAADVFVVTLFACACQIEYLGSGIAGGCRPQRCFSGSPLRRLRVERVTALREISVTQLEVYLSPE